MHQTVVNTDALFENLNTEIRIIYHESSQQLMQCFVSDQINM